MVYVTRLVVKATIIEASKCFESMKSVISAATIRQKVGMNTERIYVPENLSSAMIANIQVAHKKNLRNIWMKNMEEK